MSALRRLREAYDFTPGQARAVLDCQLRRISRARRAQLEDELRNLRDALAEPWDPPLEVQATIHSPQLAQLVIAGVQHRVRGENLEDCLGRVVSLVRGELAAPQRRRASVTTGLPGGPKRIIPRSQGGTPGRLAMTQELLPLLSGERCRFGFCTGGGPSPSPRPLATPRGPRAAARLP